MEVAHVQVGNVTWRMSAQGVEAGPLCNRLACLAQLQYMPAKTGGVKPAQDAQIVGHNRGYLVCPNCGADHLLGPVPRSIGDVRAEAEAHAAELIAKGVFV